MAFPQNTKLIFMHNSKLIHSLSLSFESSGFAYNSAQTYMGIMKSIFEDDKVDDTTKINPAEIEVWVDEAGVKRQLGL